MHGLSNQATALELCISKLLGKSRVIRTCKGGANLFLPSLEGAQVCSLSQNAELADGKQNTPKHAWSDSQIKVSHEACLPQCKQKHTFREWSRRKILQLCGPVATLLPWEGEGCILAPGSKGFVHPRAGRLGHSWGFCARKHKISQRSLKTRCGSLNLFQLFRRGNFVPKNTGSGIVWPLQPT